MFHGLAQTANERCALHALLRCMTRDSHHLVILVRSFYVHVSDWFNRRHRRLYSSPPKWYDHRRVFDGVIIDVPSVSVFRAISTACGRHRTGPRPRIHVYGKDNSVVSRMSTTVYERIVAVEIIRYMWLQSVMVGSCASLGHVTVLF